MQKQVDKWVQNQTTLEFQAFYKEQSVPLQYLWARMNIVSRSPQDLYWFVVWDNFWELNHNMECMKGNTSDDEPFKNVFGASTNTCLMYNRCSREELEEKL